MDDEVEDDGREVGIGERLAAKHGIGENPHAQEHIDFLTGKRSASVMDPTGAARVVARHVIASAVMDRCGEMWELYPEIGQYDWDAVCDEVGNVLRANVRTPLDEFEEAYEILRQRAAR